MKVREKIENIGVRERKGRGREGKEHRNKRNTAENVIMNK